MNKKAKTILNLCLAFLMCASFLIACEKTNEEKKAYEIDNEKINDAHQITEQQISSIKCKNELTSIINDSKAQKNIKAEFDGGVEYKRKIFNCYFNGTDSFIYIKKIGSRGSEYWAGKVNNEYLEFSKTYNTYVSTISQYDLEQTINRAKESVFDDYLGYIVIKSIESAQGFECLKTTNGNIIVYQMKIIEYDSTENFTITVIDGLITEVLRDDDTAFICNYSGEKIILPNKNDCEIID